MATVTDAGARVAIRGLGPDADYEAITEVSEASRTRDGLDMAGSAEQFRRGFLSIEGFDPADGVRIAEVAGEIVGYSYGYCDGDSTTIGRILCHTGRVVPAWRGRGIGRALLIEAQAAAVRHAAHRPGPAPGAAVFRAFVDEPDQDTVRLLEHDGYVIARYGFSMVRPSLADPPSSDLPPGIEVRRTTPETALQVLRAMTEAMADDWGMADFTDDGLRAWLLHPRYAQLDVWQVAWDGDDVAGGVLGYINDEENGRLGRTRGYTEQIFTRRRWRGRGIATALIGRNLRFLAERGMTEAALGVDAENPTGALSLYERVGFVRRRMEFYYQRAV